MRYILFLLLCVSAVTLVAAEPLGTVQKAQITPATLDILQMIAIETPKQIEINFMSAVSREQSDGRNIYLGHEDIRLVKAERQNRYGFYLLDGPDHKFFYWRESTPEKIQEEQKNFNPECQATVLIHQVVVIQLECKGQKYEYIYHIRDYSYRFKGFETTNWLDAQIFQELVAGDGPLPAVEMEPRKKDQPIIIRAAGQELAKM